jgi:hypothetical protein
MAYQSHRTAKGGASRQIAQGPQACRLALWDDPESRPVAP